MKDKIIQITDTLTDDGDGQTYGLSENGNLYQYKADYVIAERDESGRVTKQATYKNHRWELIVKSPDIDLSKE